jgi:carbamoyl-phosphate synthase small subunit
LARFHSKGRLCSRASVSGKPVFSVQHHPEASPGPQDSHYLFKRFVNLIRERKGEPALAER